MVNQHAGARRNEAPSAGSMVAGDPGITATGLIHRHRGRGGAGIGPLDVRTAGEPTLLLGENGAGKTTLLRVLGGELRAREGTLDGVAGAVYVPQHFRAVRGFTCREYAAYVGWLWGASRSAARAGADHALEVVGLGEMARHRCDRLSGGQEARLQFATALNSGARVVLLDEPAAALDPVSRERIAGLYGTILEQGVQLVVSTHGPEEVGPPFARVVAMARGRVIFQGPRAEFLGQDDAGDPDLAALAGAVRRMRGHR